MASVSVGASSSIPHELAKIELSSSVTVARYIEMRDEGDKRGLTKFVKERLLERYVIPLQSVPRTKKNGFLIMAASCLLIETLESFYQGWENTEKGVERKDILDPCKPVDLARNMVSSSEVAFCYFFKRESTFSAFRAHAHGFYKHVRCGILHQGESTGGWIIRREGDLFDDPHLTINAAKFLRAVRTSVRAYGDRLRIADWQNDDLWKHFRKKMETIIDHCRR